MPDNFTQKIKKFIIHQESIDDAYNRLMSNSHERTYDVTDIPSDKLILGLARALPYDPSYEPNIDPDHVDEQAFLKTIRDSFITEPFGNGKTGKIVGKCHNIFNVAGRDLDMEIFEFNDGKKVLRASPHFYTNQYVGFEHIPEISDVLKAIREDMKTESAEASLKDEEAKTTTFKLSILGSLFKHQQSAESKKEDETKTDSEAETKTEKKPVQNSAVIMLRNKSAALKRR